MDDTLVSSMLEVYGKNQQSRSLIIRFILYYNPRNLSKQDEDGNSLLHHALMYCDYGMAEYLLNRGADTYCMNKSGLRPIDFM
jgi:ankyrin repeat protein